MINAKQIEQEGLLKLEETFGQPAQVGYDLSIKSANKVGEGEKIGKILIDKTHLTDYTPYDLISFEGRKGWLFYPGVYDITFNEGCNIPANRTAFIKQRSSLKRNGASISSPLFDPGFITDNMGTIMIVSLPIFIEKNARVAQIYFHESTSTDNQYNGSFQNDKQRLTQ